MTPVNLVRHNSLELQQGFGGDCVDDSLSMDTQDIIDQPVFTSITEIAVSTNFEYLFLYNYISLLIKNINCIRFQLSNMLSCIHR